MERWRGRLVVGLLVTGVTAAAGAVCLIWINWNIKSKPEDEEFEAEEKSETESINLSLPQSLSNQPSIQSLDSGVSSLPYKNQKPPKSVDKLSKDILQKYLASKQTKWTWTAKRDFCQELELLVEETRVDLELNCPISIVMIGGSICELAMDNGDLDLCLLTPGEKLSQQSQKSLASVIHETKLSIAKPTCFNSSISFSTPLSRRRSVKVNLIINEESKIRISHLLACYAAVDARFSQLFCVIKLWAKKGGIMGRKGLTDQALAYMLIHYLQTGCWPPVLPCLHTDYHMLFNNWSDINTLLGFRPDNYISANNDTLGALLVGFLQFYSRFDFGQQVVSIKRSRAISRSESDCKDPICIQAPFPSHKVNAARRITNEEFPARFRDLLSQSLAKLVESQDLRSLLAN